MVKSIINSTLSYNDTTQISENDIGLENVQSYEVKLLDISLYVILGSIDNTFEETHNVVFTPIYLLNPTNKFTVSKRIGMYELKSDEISNHRDESDPNQLVLDSLKDKVPLIFSFVTEQFLKPFSKNSTILKIKPPKKSTKLIDETATESSTTDNVDTEGKVSSDDDIKTIQEPEMFKLKEQISEGSLPWTVHYFKDINFKLFEKEDTVTVFLIRKTSIRNHGTREPMFKNFIILLLIILQKD